MKEYTYFDNDEQGKGKKACDVFCEYIGKKGFDWRPASKEEQARGIDVVSNHPKNTFEVKHQTFKDAIVIEEKSINGSWINNSEAHVLVEISSDYKHYIAMNMQELKHIYGKIKNNYSVLTNKDTTIGNRGDIWDSQFRVIPLCHIEPYMSIIYRGRIE